MCCYPNPFITERADPYIVKGPDGFYYFTASYPAFQNADNGYDRIILRKSETVSGLKDATEHTIWKAHEKGEMAKHIWAPELHFIGGKYYIFFASGDSDNKWNIRPYALRCKGDDPINDPWEELGRIKPFSEEDPAFSDFSLDMTYFENMGKHYLIWAQKSRDSSLFIGEINPENPCRLISKSVLLTKPEYPWEKVRHSVNEGPAVLKTEDKIFLFFSASGTGEEYCMGMLYANKNSDLMNISSWEKLPCPVLETKDLTGEAGPGHNSFVVDEKGKLLLVYHSRPVSHSEKNCGTFCEEVLYDPCRHTRIKEVLFDENNFPVLK